MAPVPDPQQSLPVTYISRFIRAMKIIEAVDSYPAAEWIYDSTVKKMSRNDTVADFSCK